MRTIAAGIAGLRRTPLAGLPLAIEGLFGAVFVLAGALPATGGTVPATAVFPLDVFFDLREALTHSENWWWFAAAMSTGVLVRSLVLASTLWLSEEAPGPFAIAWLRALRLSVIAAAALLPSAGLFFTGVAIRYAPFIWAAALLGLVPALVLARQAARLDVGGAPPVGKGVPELFSYLAYGYLLALFGAALSILAETNEWLSAFLVACLGPLHACILLGWREHVREKTFPGGGFVAAAATVAIVGLLGLTAVYDRYIRNPPPVGRAGAAGSLLLLGGIDTTSDTGALAEFDPRQLGFNDQVTKRLSYRGPDASYTKEDTHGDLTEIGEAVGEQVADAEYPTYLLGHSQAALILDRMIERGRPLPERAVLLAPSPPLPPPFEVPDPGEDGPGKPGGDVARGLSELLDLVGLQPFDIDAEASPVNLERSIVPSDVPRLSVWAVGDSVWLYDDWRRPGERNVVAITDHVGVTSNSRALDAARRFFDDKRVRGDDGSWRSALVGVLRYAFEPWRPR